MNCFHGGEIFQTRGQKSRAEFDLSSHRRRGIFIFTGFLVFGQRARDQAPLRRGMGTPPQENCQPAHHNQNGQATSPNTLMAGPGTIGRWSGGIIGWRLWLSGDFGLSGNGVGFLQGCNDWWFLLFDNYRCGCRCCGHRDRNNGFRRFRWRNDRWFHLFGRCGCCHWWRDGSFVGAGSVCSGAGWLVGFGFLGQSRRHSSNKDDGANGNPSFHRREFSRPAAKSHGRILIFFIEPAIRLPPVSGHGAT